MIKITLTLHTRLPMPLLFDHLELGLGKVASYAMYVNVAYGA